jgi:YesN/AraC family two-component response regulator
LHDSSGIGLALVKQLVELHGGQMYVESERGKGSHFYFDLTELCDDCIDNETALSDVKMNSDRYEKWEEMLKLERSNIQDELIITNDLKSAELPAVLVVDDNKEICQALNDTLKEKYKIYIADNGKKALGVVDKENIDIVISDIMMPELDGIGLCKELKSNIKTSHIPVVLITAKSGIDNELAGLRTGADAYITKPFNYEKVLLVVENIIDGKKKVQKLLKGKEIGEELEPGLNPLDMKLIEKINQIISLKITDANFSVDELGREAGLSRMHLFRKIKALTGYSPSDFIKKSRLERSKELIEKGELSISEIAYDTGFSTPGNFSTAFKKFFGQTPAQYRAECFSSSCK